MSNLIGKKSSFGFEYNIRSRHHHIMGNMRLWIEGKYIGAFDDLNILSAIFLQFEGLELKNIDGYKFLGKKDEEIYYELVDDHSLDNWRYNFSPGESFDDFIILTYICDDRITFIWKLVDNPYFEYSDYPKDIQSAQVSVDEFQKVVMEFKKILSA